MEMLRDRKLGYMLSGLAIVLIVVLSLAKASTDEQGAFLCDAVQANPDLDMADCPAHKSNTSWLLFGSFGVVFLIFGLGLYMIFAPVPAKKELMPIDVSKLDDQESEVYQIIKNKEGSVYQSDLMKELDISKVKLTRILDKMESKGVLERKRRGMTNIVVFK